MKCIRCGHCISVCRHSAHDYTDDTHAREAENKVQEQLHKKKGQALALH